MKADLPNLILWRQVYYARLVIPADVRAIFGKTVLKQTTGERDPVQAAAKAGPLVKEWKRRIEAARQGGKTAMQIEVDKLSTAFRNARRKTGEDFPDQELQDAVAFVVERIARTHMDDYEGAVHQTGDIHDAVERLPNGRQAARVLDVIVGRTTPFLTHLDAWRAAVRLEGRQLSQYVADLKQFSTDTDCAIEALVATDVQKWIETQAAAGISPKTIQRKLAALRNYWGWLQSHQIVAEGNKPLSGRRIPLLRKADEPGKRMPFAPAQVVALWKAALKRGDQPLADFIMLGAYTGARIEEASSLLVSDIDRSGPIHTMHLSSKTDAGDRVVPIHSAITKLIEGLMTNPDRAGYLIHSTAANQYAERSVPLGKRFGRLKTVSGYDHRYVFHSLRKTVTTLLEDAQCPEGIAADIVGHEKTSMTYGLYSGGSSLETRRAWLEKAVVYPGWA